MDFEDILQKVGGYGKFQRNLTIFFLIPVSCVIPCFWMNFIFMVSVPDHWCNVPELASSNLSVAEQRVLISPPEDPSCTMYNINYTMFLHSNEGPLSSNGSEIVTSCKYGWQFDTKHYDATAATKFNLVCDKAHYPSLLLTLQNVGSLIGTPIYGLLSDRFGRKIVFLILAIVVSTTELASVFVNDFVIFAILRTINGSVVPSMFTLPYILLTEIVSPEMRAHMNGVFNCCWTIGLCALPLVAYFARTWIILGAISAAVGFSFLLYWRYLPESPCWYVSQGRYEEAMHVMMRVGEQNGKPQNQAHMLMQLQSIGQRIEKTKDHENDSDNSCSLLKYPRLRRNFFILSFCWIAFYVAYTGLTYNIRNLNGNEFVNFFLLSVVEMPGNLTFWFLMDRYGRRWSSTFGFFSIGVICLLPVTGLESSDIISSMMGKFLISGIIMISDQQASELFPTVARSFGIGTGKTIATAATIMIPYISHLSVYGKSVPFLLVSFTCFITAALASFLPETLNENLPQTITDAEEFGKDQKYFTWIRKNASKVDEDPGEECKVTRF